MNNILFVAAVAGIVTLLGCAKVVVIKVPTEGRPMEQQGVFYALPKTVIRVSLTVEKVELEEGRFAKFAGIFAPGGERVCKALTCSDDEKKSYRTKTDAALSTFGQPDPENIYMVKFAGYGELDQKLTIEWNENGLLSGTSASVTNRTTDIVVSGLKLAAGLGTKIGSRGILSDAGEKVVSKTDECFPQKSSNDTWVIKTLRTNVKSDSVEALKSNYCNIKKDERDTWKEETDKRFLLAAIDAYAPVSELLSLRQNALGGDSIMDPTTILAKLDALIAENLNVLYLGTKKVTPWTGLFDIHDLVDDAGKLNNATLLRIDKSGFCAVADPVPGQKEIPNEDRLKTCTGTDVQLQLVYYPDATQQLFNIIKTRTVDPDNDEKSFRYRIPAQVRATVTDASNKTYGAAVLSIAQSGVTVALPASRQSKTLEYNLKFIEATGGLKSFILGTTGGLDSGVIDQLSGIGNSIADARNKALAQQKAEEDELNVLTRKANILKLKDQICDLQKKQGMTCDVIP